MPEGRHRFHDRLAGIEAGAECERLAPQLSALADGEATAVSMCASEPKGAQVAMQIWANDLRDQLGGKSVADAQGNAQTLRLLVGSTFIAYSISRNCLDDVPPELVPIVGMNSVIRESSEFVLQEFARSNSA